MDKKGINIGDTVIIPEELNDGVRCMARVQAIYNRFILFETKEGSKITLQISDLPKFSVIKGESDENKEVEENIIESIIG